MNSRNFKIPTFAILLVLSPFSFADITKALNINIEKCFAQTLQTTERASIRACNNVIKSRISSRQNIAIAFHNRGIIQMQNGKLEQALTSFKRSLRFQPKELSKRPDAVATTLLAIAKVHQAAHEHELAMVKIDEARALDRKLK